MVQALASVRVGGVADMPRAIDHGISTFNARGLLFILSDFQQPLPPIQQALG
jgi:hypothetical protein